MPPPPPATMPPMDRLIEIIRILLGPAGCPWDRAQTHTTLKPYLIEECHELIDAIDRGDRDAICEESGDVLLQLLLHAEMERAAGRLGFDDVARGIAEKVVRRHPHVFGEEVPARDPAEVQARWDAEKRKERRTARGGGGGRGSLLDGIPLSLPALLHATKLSRRAARVGFDWPDAAGVRGKLDEELRELDDAIVQGDPVAIRHEIGDVLFVIASLARHLGHDPEEALRECTRRFRHRFHGMEALAEAAGRPLAPSAPGAPPRPIEELDALWERAKADTPDRL